MSYSEWKIVKLEDILDIPIRNGLSKPKAIRGNGIKMVNMGEIFKYDRIFDIEMDRVPTTEKEYVNSKLEKGDLLFARQSLVWEGAGKCSIIMEAKEDLVYESHIIRARLNKGLVDPFFYYYYFKSYAGKENIRSIVEQVAAAGIRGSDLVKLQIPFPELKEQKAITATLSCLDDKIELKRCVNKNLQETVQAIFKNWFVDFEPFKDGDFEDSELGEIPKGWRVGTIGELISDTLGGDWGKEAPKGNYTEEVVCIRGADIPEIASGKKGKPPIRYILKKNMEKKRLSEGQIIIEISGGSPTQSTGRTALITQELVNLAGKPLVCTNFCRALSMKKDHYATFVYSTLQYLYNRDVLFSYENGTTGIKNLDTNNLFNKHLIVLPDDESILKYKEIFDTIINSIYQNGAEIDRLETIRDTLLPKLMSGEIRVPIEGVQ